MAILEKAPQSTMPAGPKPSFRYTAAMAKTPCDLLIDARWLLPIAPENRVLEDASVAIAGDTVLALGPRAEMHAAHDARNTLSLPTHVLLPGLVNAHGHAAMSLLRGFAVDAPVEQWLHEHIWPLEARLVGEDFVHDGASLAVAEMIRGGTTCFSDMYFFPEATAAVARSAGVRCQVAFPIIQFANAWSRDSGEALHKGMALHDHYRGDPLIQVAFGPHAAYSVSRADLERIRTYADELDAGVHIHLHETAQEVRDANASEGMNWIEVLRDVGLLGPRLQAVHVTQVEAGDIELLAESQVHVVHCPRSNVKLASGVCPVAAMHDAGVNVALGSDGAASANSLDMLGEARLAGLLAKLQAGDPRVLPDPRTLEMATLGGARALGLEDRIGSLEPGKQADLVAVDLQAARFQPVFDPTVPLVHGEAGSAVSHVWVAGQALLTDGVLKTLDEASVLANAAAWQRRIRD